MQRYTIYYIWKVLYMFRMVPPHIIRSAHTCIYSIWYLSHRYCYLPLSWKSWNRFECAVGGVRQYKTYKYIGILLGAHLIIHISRIRVNDTCRICSFGGRGDCVVYKGMRFLSHRVVKEGYGAWGGGWDWPNKKEGGSDPLRSIRCSSHNAVGKTRTGNWVSSRRNGMIEKEGTMTRTIGTKLDRKYTTGTITNLKTNLKVSGTPEIWLWSWNKRTMPSHLMRTVSLANKSEGKALCPWFCGSRECRFRL
jgi:hypothetical protein